MKRKRLGASFAEVVTVQLGSKKLGFFAQGMDSASEKRFMGSATLCAAGQTPGFWAIL
jgi:hypothetical protein